MIMLWQEFVSTFASDPDLQEISVPTRWRKGVRPSQTYLGKCFYESDRYFRQFSQSRDIWFVTGTALGSTAPITGHAWIVRMHPDTVEEVCFDGVFQLFFEKSLYLELRQAVEFKRYSPSEYRAIGGMGGAASWVREQGIPFK